jgi:hypothetical protein
MAECNKSIRRKPTSWLRAASSVTLRRDSVADFLLGRGSAVVKDGLDHHCQSDAWWEGKEHRVTVIVVVDQEFQTEEKRKWDALSGCSHGTPDLGPAGSTG